MWLFGTHGEFADSVRQLPTGGPGGLARYDPLGFDLIGRLYDGTHESLRGDVLEAPPHRLRPCRHGAKSVATAPHGKTDGAGTANPMGGSSSAPRKGTGSGTDARDPGLANGPVAALEASGKKPGASAAVQGGWTATDATRKADEELEAEDAGEERSRTHARTLEICNNGPTAVTLSWIDETGVGTKYGTVPAGGALAQRSYPGHVWELTDGDAGEVRRYRVSRARNQRIEAAEDLDLAP